MVHSSKYVSYMPDQLAVAIAQLRTALGLPVMQHFLCLSRNNHRFSNGKHEVQANKIQYP